MIHKSIGLYAKKYALFQIIALLQLTIVMAPAMKAKEVADNDKTSTSKTDFFSTEYDYHKFYTDWIKGHFDIGLRITDYNFDRRKESPGSEKYFIGSIDSIQAEDPGYGLHNLNLAWFPWADSFKNVNNRFRPLFLVMRGLGVEITWGHLRAKTITSAQNDTPAYSDGTIIAKAPLLSYVLRINNRTRVTPYFGIGTAFYNDVSVTRDWWHLGFYSKQEYDQWRASGATGEPDNDRRRNFTVDTENGRFWYVGATIDVYENWQLDLFYRATEVVFDNTYTILHRGDLRDRRYSKWDLSNKTYGLGLRYAF